MAADLPEPLRTQALASIGQKSFHCIGGSVYIHYPGVETENMLSLIVALQTISDYLDNLCDRLALSDSAAFRTLHQSFLTALQPSAPIDNYYHNFPYQENFYLPALVTTCQECLKKIPFYQKRQARVLKLADYYCQLQILKHLLQGEKKLRKWVSLTFSAELEWYEWAAAAGSTLGIFLFCALAYREEEQEETNLLQAYFPWLQGLHILLDYLIDLTEDKVHGDLNFVAYYPTIKARTLALKQFAAKASQLAANLPDAYFHQTVISGLIALYGSDPKVKQQQLQSTIKQISPNTTTKFMTSICKILRRVNYLPS